MRSATLQGGGKVNPGNLPGKSPAIRRRYRTPARLRSLHGYLRARADMRTTCAEKRHCFLQLKRIHRGNWRFACFHQHLQQSCGLIPQEESNDDY